MRRRWLLLDVDRDRARRRRIRVAVVGNERELVAPGLVRIWRVGKRSGRGIEQRHHADRSIGHEAVRECRRVGIVRMQIVGEGRADPDRVSVIERDRGIVDGREVDVKSEHREAIVAGRQTISVLHTELEFVRQRRFAAVVRVGDSAVVDVVLCERRARAQRVAAQLECAMQRRGAPAVRIDRVGDLCRRAFRVDRHQQRIVDRAGAALGYRQRRVAVEMRREAAGPGDGRNGDANQ